jgi:hypothetical protein
MLILIGIDCTLRQLLSVAEPAGCGLLNSYHTGILTVSLMIIHGFNLSCQRMRPDA